MDDLKINLLIHDSEQYAMAEDLCKSLCVNNIVTRRKAAGDDWVVEIIGRQFHLHAPRHTKFKPFSLNFNKYRLSAGRDPLVQALGTQVVTVADLTAGWCDDAVHLARQGYTVSAIENHPLIFAMVKNAWDNLDNGVVKAGIRLHHSEGTKWLEREDKTYDVIYLDPMYPEKTKSAASKKALRILHLMQVSQPDPVILLRSALHFANKRVIVKRPHHAVPLLQGKVGEIKTKLVRFDIYKPDHFYSQ